MRQVLMQLRPESMEDLIAVISFTAPARWTPSPLLYPKPLQPGPCHLQTPAAQAHSDVTYGCIVLPGAGHADLPPVGWILLLPADLVRRAVSKKKADVMEKERQNFVHGAPKEDGLGGVRWGRLPTGSARRSPTASLTR